MALGCTYIKKNSMSSRFENETPELERESRLLSRLCTAYRSRLEVGGSAKSLVSEIYRNGRTQRPLI